MSYIKVDNKFIISSIHDILKKVREETNNYFFDDIVNKGHQLCITCPCHKNGKERHPSCYITDDDTSDLNGVWHCFTCGASGTLVDLISICFNEDFLFSSEWLLSRFSSSFIEYEEILPEITFKKVIKPLNNRDIEKYENNKNNYLYERGVSDDVIKKFRIGSTLDGKFVTFPCWDIHDRYVGTFMRSTVGKNFVIPQNIDKPVYLLNFIVKEGITKVVICEGIVDALVMWSYGYPAVALFGSGTTKYQMDAINKSGIRDFTLMYDNDFAGRSGADRFKKMIRKDVFVTDILMPQGKDCASCTKEEIKKLLNY